MSRRTPSRRTDLTRPPSTPPLPTRHRGTTTEDNQSEKAVLTDPLVGILLTDIEAAGGIASSWKLQDLCNNNPESYGRPGSERRRHFQKITDQLKNLSREEYLELINFFGILSATHTHSTSNLQRTFPHQVLFAAAPPAFDDDSESDDERFLTQRIVCTPPNFQSPTRTLTAFQDYPSPSRSDPSFCCSLSCHELSAICAFARIGSILWYVVRYVTQFNSIAYSPYFAPETINVDLKHPERNGQVLLFQYNNLIFNNNQ